MWYLVGVVGFIHAWWTLTSIPSTTVPTIPPGSRRYATRSLTLSIDCLMGWLTACLACPLLLKRQTSTSLHTNYLTTNLTILFGSKTIPPYLRNINIGSNLALTKSSPLRVTYVTSRQLITIASYQIPYKSSGHGSACRTLRSHQSPSYLPLPDPDRMLSPDLV